MSDDAKPPPLDEALLEFMPSFARKIATLDDASGRAWDERIRRIAALTATDEDRRVHALAEAALESGTEMPSECRRMPTQPPSPKRTGNWRPAHLDTEERAVSIGIPPLIATRIIAGQGFETRSTKACSKVGIDYMILVIIGERGCGKTYAAADWLWSSERDVPRTLDRRATPRRFIDAPSLKEIEFADRPALGLATALVVDDAGTEQDFLISDWAGIFIQRYRNALPTVITTNLSEADFGERYGMRFVSRMNEIGKFFTASNNAADDLRGRV